MNRKTRITALYNTLLLNNKDIVFINHVANILDALIEKSNDSEKYESMFFSGKPPVPECPRYFKHRESYWKTVGTEPYADTVSVERKYAQVEYRYASIYSEETPTIENTDDYYNRDGKGNTKTTVFVRPILIEDMEILQISENFKEVSKEEWENVTVEELQQLYLDSNKIAFKA